MREEHTSFSRAPQRRSISASKTEVFVQEIVAEDDSKEAEVARDDEQGPVQRATEAHIANTQVVRMLTDISPVSG